MSLSICLGTAPQLLFLLTTWHVLLYLNAEWYGTFLELISVSTPSRPAILPKQNSHILCNGSLPNCLQKPFQAILHVVNGLHQHTSIGRLTYKFSNHIKPHQGLR